MSRALSYGAPSSPRLGSLAFVVLIHLLLGWALTHGLAQRVVEIVTRPIEVDIVEPDTQPDPLPPPPTMPVPEFAPPPPSFVPPPEVRVPPPPVPPPTITTTPTPPPPVPVTIAPPPAPVPVPAPVVAAPAPPPPAPPPDLSAPARIDVARCDPPTYPPAARRANVTGTTVVQFQVDATGRVVSADVLRRAGGSREHRMLDSEAVQALGQCRFQPGRDRAGRPVGGSARVEYVWRLD